MEIPKPEERAALSVSTPADIAVLRFSSSRAQEIAALTNLIGIFDSLYYINKDNFNQPWTYV